MNLQGIVTKPLINECKDLEEYSKKQKVQH